MAPRYPSSALPGELIYPWCSIYEAFPGRVVGHGKAGGVQQEPGEEDGPRCGWAQPQRGAREPVGRAPMLAWVVLLLHRFGFDVWFEKINVQL